MFENVAEQQRVERASRQGDVFALGVEREDLIELLRCLFCCVTVPFGPKDVLCRAVEVLRQLRFP